MRKIAITLTLLCVAAFAQQKGTFKDTRDKKTYKTVKIGTQTWMAENLNYDPEPGNNRASTCFQDKPANCTKYGRIYFGAGSEVCPSGWHLPSDREWQILVDFAGKDAGKDLKAKSGWDNKSNGTDKFGFAALPGGLYCDGEFSGIGTSGGWYSVGNSAWVIFENNEVQKWGCASYVRCVQGDAEAAAKAEEEAKAAEAKAKADAEAAKMAALKASTITDSRDKKSYKTVTIGTQTWMAENLNYDAKGSKCFNNEPANCDKYGRLYDWNTAKTACLSGWHLPSNAEWAKLTDFVGGSSTAGMKLKAKSSWLEKGTDDYGFSALPGGKFSLPINTRDSGFLDISWNAYWWSSTSHDVATSAYYLTMSSNKDTQIYPYAKGFLLSVRCVQGEAPKEEPAAKQAEKPAAKQAEPSKADPPKQSSTEFCTITFPKKACIAMPKGTCKMSGGKVVDKCP